MAPVRRARIAVLVSLVGLVPTLSSCNIEQAGEKAFIVAANTRCKMQWQQIRMAREGLAIARDLGLTKKLEDRYSALRDAALAGVKGVPVPGGVEDVYSAFTGGAAEVVQQLQDGEISGGDLALVHTQFVGDTLVDRFHHGSESGDAACGPPGASI